MGVWREAGRLVEGGKFFLIPLLSSADGISNGHGTGSCKVSWDHTGDAALGEANLKGVHSSYSAYREKWIDIHTNELVYIYLFVDKELFGFQNEYQWLY